MTNAKTLAGAQDAPSTSSMTSITTGQGKSSPEGLDCPPGRSSGRVLESSWPRPPATPYRRRRPSDPKPGRDLASYRPRRRRRSAGHDAVYKTSIRVASPTSTTWLGYIYRSYRRGSWMQPVRADSRRLRLRHFAAPADCFATDDGLPKRAGCLPYFESQARRICVSARGSFIWFCATIGVVLANQQAKIGVIARA